jgi:hypothetical protein
MWFHSFEPLNEQKPRTFMPSIEFGVEGGRIGAMRGMVAGTPPENKPKPRSGASESPARVCVLP